MSDEVIEAFLRVGARYKLSDQIARDYFVKLVSDVPVEMRARFLRPEWIIGFVSGLLYAHTRSGEKSEYEDARVLYSIVDTAFKQMCQVPYVGDKN
jgi:hypothetical protein